MTNQKAIKAIEHIVDSKCLAIGNFTLFEEEKEAMKIAIEALKMNPRKSGEWLEKEIFEDPSFPKYQSARCSVCNLYHTTPFICAFEDYKYCPRCGAKMEEEE